ncbi:MAG TPA: thioredoxin-disulfide reductase [Candidatus Omnitrophica bacterium]|nr:thioredoxin-disulfide reductase [Candidatus Omnitrophota bacterium]
MKRYDLIIVGAGSAGITAAIYASRQKLNFLIITMDIGGQTTLSGDIENYTGYQFITGPELVGKFKEHLDKFGIELKENERVTHVEKKRNYVEVTSEKGIYQSKTFIIASGRTPRNLNVEGEEKFKNRGLTYCATCDGPLFAEKEVAVIGGGNSGLDATLQLVRIAKKIHLIEIEPQLKADSIMVEKAKESEKVTLHTSTRVERISGDTFVKEIEISKEGKREKLNVEGVFVEIGSIPNSGFVEGIVKNKFGEIVVDCTCRTNLDGILAAGDVTNVYAKQIIVACGEGAKAAIAASDYLNR